MNATLHDRTWIYNISGDEYRDAQSEETGSMSHHYGMTGDCGVRFLAGCGHGRPCLQMETSGVEAIAGFTA